MPELKTYDMADRLENEEEIGHYLAAAAVDGDPIVLALARANAARARRRNAR